MWSAPEGSIIAATPTTSMPAPLEIQRDESGVDLMRRCEKVSSTIEPQHGPERTHQGKPDLATLLCIRHGTVPAILMIEAT
jgi:hypothetical protein